METVAKIIVPICTFLLGIVFTILFKRHEQRKTVIRQHTGETVKQINEWYNQLHSLNGDLRGLVTKDEAEARIYLYVSNRLILPKLLLSLGVLRKHRASERLVKNAEDFLMLVTTYRPDEPNELVECLFLERCALLTIMGDRKEAQAENLERLLPQLDAKLQRINQQAAKLLAK